MQVVLLILSGLSSACSSIGRSFSEHSGFWMIAAFFIGKHMPEKIPVTPQGIWSWSRDAIQSYISTKEPGPVQHPTQPALTVPDQPKP